MKKAVLPLITLTCFCLFSCKHLIHREKTNDKDPFKNTMVASQFFELDASQGNVVEGKKGSIISFPKGCFLNSKGQMVNGKVKIELAEALNLSDMLLSNLTTTTNGQLLETGGMLYLNATSGNGADLVINKDKPVYIEVPTKSRLEGMKIYKGLRNDLGDMNWVEPRDAENYLVNVDINTLNFLPDGFEATVKCAMPWKDYTIATPQLADSLYYSLAFHNPLLEYEGSVTNLNEPYMNPDRQVINGQYTTQSYSTTPNQESSDSSNTPLPGGIDPAIIKTLRTARFQKTFISTKEFETRLQTIFKTCDNQVLMLYVNNLDKPLWQVDEMAADHLGRETNLGKRFLEYAALKQTNVQDGGENTELLKNYFNTHLTAVRNDLQQLENTAQAQLAAHNRVADSVAEAYRGLLWKREKYRMERYGFKWSNTGWLNIDRPAKEATDTLVMGATLRLKIENSTVYDRVESYVVLEDIQSIEHLPEGDKGVFNNAIPLLYGKPAKAIAIGYKGSDVFMGVVSFTTVTDYNLSLSLTQTTMPAVKQMLAQIETGNFGGNVKATADTNGAKQSAYLEENSVAVDLEYQDFFYKEQKFQQRNHDDNELLKSLYFVAHPCGCGDEDSKPLSIREGRELFKSNCRACHSVCEDGTGPALVGVTKRHTMCWLISFTRNWHDLVSEGEPDAVAMAASRPAEMNVYSSLTDPQIRAIYRYIDEKKCNWAAK